MAKRAYKYTEILGKSVGLHATTADEIRAWLYPRYLALFADCGVKTNDEAGWAGVAFALALRHVPGFDLEGPKRRGARKKTNMDEDLFILTEMQKRLGKGGKGVQTNIQAAGYVARLRNKGETANAIARRYGRIMKFIGDGVTLLRAEASRQK